MAKYIDADALKDIIYNYNGAIGFIEENATSKMAADIIREINKMPAADVEPVRKWISCSEQMPEPYANVILCRPDADGGMIVEQGYWCGNGWWKVFGTRTMRVTAWQPLPEPPKMDGGSNEL